MKNLLLAMLVLATSLSAQDTTRKPMQMREQRQEMMRQHPMRPDSMRGRMQPRMDSMRMNRPPQMPMQMRGPMRPENRNDFFMMNGPRRFNRWECEDLLWRVSQELRIKASERRDAMLSLVYSAQEVQKMDYLCR